MELAYKGPKLDARTKARVEVTLLVGDADAARALLAALGFAPVAEVRRTRALFHYLGLLLDRGIARK